MWKQRSVRAWDTFLEIKHEHGIQDGGHEDDPERLHDDYPEVFKAYRQAHSMETRYEKEKKVGMRVGGWGGLGDGRGGGG